MLVLVLVLVLVLALVLVLVLALTAGHSIVEHVQPARRVAHGAQPLARPRCQLARRPGARAGPRTLAPEFALHLHVRVRGQGRPASVQPQRACLLHTRNARGVASAAGLPSEFSRLFDRASPPQRATSDTE